MAHLQTLEDKLHIEELEPRATVRLLNEAEGITRALATLFQEQVTRISNAHAKSLSTGPTLFNGQNVVTGTSQSAQQSTITLSIKLGDTNETKIYPSTNS